MSGPRTPLDPRIHAVRRDLADIRLADRVFAPHYAAPRVHRAVAAADLRESRDAEAPVVATLAAGDEFEVLEIAGGFAWGIATGPGLVGYVAADALAGAARA